MCSLASLTDFACNDSNIGGIQAIYVTLYSYLDLSTITLAGTSGADARAITDLALSTAGNEVLVKIDPEVEETATYTSAVEKPSARSNRYNSNTSFAITSINKETVQTLVDLQKCCEGYVIFILTNDGQCYVDGIRVVDPSVPSFRKTLMPVRSAESDGINQETLDGGEPTYSFAFSGMDNDQPLFLEPAAGTARDFLDALL